MNMKIIKSIAFAMLALAFVASPVLADSLTGVNNAASRGKVRKLEGTGVDNGYILDAIHQVLLDDMKYLTDASAMGALADGKVFVGDGADAPAAVDFSGDITIINTGVTSFAQSETIGGNPAGAANDVNFGTTGLIYEGATDDTIETLVTATDPTTTDKTITLPDATGTVMLSSVAALAAGDATPDVVPGVSSYTLAQAGAQDVTDFDAYIDGQVITILTTTADTTFKDGATIECGGDVTPSAKGATTFIVISDVWYMVATNDG
jgi:hypothetical protein